MSISSMNVIAILAIVAIAGFVVYWAFRGLPPPKDDPPTVPPPT